MFDAFYDVSDLASKGNEQAQRVYNHGLMRSGLRAVLKLTSA